MDLDRERVAEVLARPHSFYGSGKTKWRIDSRLNPGTRTFIGSQFTSEMNVLDVGCGDGATLIENAGRFAHGTGIDPDPEHLHLAQAAAGNVANLTFHESTLGDFVATATADSYDFVYTERGPFGYSPDTVGTALSLVKPGGLLFAEVIGDLHHQEVREVFGGARFNVLMSVADQTRVAFTRAGVDVRIAADVVSKRYYPDVYSWLEFQCGIWAWSGTSFPEPDDQRLELFVRRNTTPDGEIETTHHVTWIGGIKR